MTRRQGFSWLKVTGRSVKARFALPSECCVVVSCRTQITNMYLLGTFAWLWSTGGQPLIFLSHPMTCAWQIIKTSEDTVHSQTRKTNSRGKGGGLILSGPAVNYVTLPDPRNKGVVICYHGVSSYLLKDPVRLPAQSTGEEGEESNNPEPSSESLQRSSLFPALAE